MTCKRAGDVDLLGLLAEESSGDLDDFRAHYPGCPECAAEVAAWSALQLSLRGGSDEIGQHPTPEALLKFEQEPQAMAAGDREDIAMHLRSCRACADESRSLAGFDFDRLREQPAPASTVSAIGHLFAFWRSLAMRPAFAYGIAVVALAPAVILYLSIGTTPDATHRGVSAPFGSREPHAIKDPSEAATLELAPSWRGRGEEPKIVISADASREIHLSISLPLEVIPNAQVEVRVVGPHEHRQLAERVAWTEPLRLNLPSAWLKPGRYTVRVQPIGVGKEVPALPMYGFVVR